MRIFLFIIFVQLNLTTAIGQQTFVFNYSNPDNERPTDILETENGDLFLSAVSCKQETGFSDCNGLILKLNANGGLIDSLEIDIPNKSFYIRDVISLAEDTILISGMSRNIDRTNCCFELITVNKQLETIQHVTYCFPANYKSLCVYTKKGNNKILITGCIILPVNLVRVFAFKLSTSLDSLNCKILHNIPGVGVDIREIPNNEYWIVNDIATDYLKLDSTFSEINSINIPYFLSAPYGIKWYSDTSFYLAGELNYGSEDNIGILRQNTIYDVIDYIYIEWGIADTLDIPARFGALDFGNIDSIYIGGSKNFYPNYFTSIPSWYFLIQTDSMLNVRWEKFIGGKAFYTVDKLKVARDGSCFLASAKYDYMLGADHTDLELIKVNHLGQFVHLPENPSIKIREAIVYPNPGTDQLNIRLATQHAKANFQLYDNRGGLIMNQTLTKKVTQINTNFLKSGTYVFRIYNENGLYEEGKWVKIQ